jgi:uncharacterized membrane protein YdjX (TVP38/TMEM64 family)
MDKKLLQRLLIVAAIVVAVILFKVLGLGHYLTLDYLKSSQDKFSQLYGENRLAVIAAFMAIYITVTALSLPGAAVMTLAGGAMFGFWIGFVVVSFASTIGATLACFVARFLLRDWVQNRFGDKLSTINNGIEKEGAFYLSFFCYQPGNGVDHHEAFNFLLGLANRHVTRHHGLCERRQRTGTD